MAQGKVGNYADTRFTRTSPRATEAWMKDSTDGFATTAPVGSLPANGFGLYDLGGNEWEWCEDWYNGAQKDCVLRGGAWRHGGHDRLLSSCRAHFAPTPTASAACSCRRSSAA